MCGKQVSADARFCPECGRKLPGSTLPTVPPPPHVAAPVGSVITETKNPGIAALLALVLAGIGHIYVGKIGKGLVILVVYYFLALLAGLAFMLGFLTLGLGFIFAIPLGLGMLVIWAWQIYDAYKLAKQFNAHVEQYGKTPW